MIFNARLKDLNERRRNLEGEEILIKNERQDKLTELCKKKTELIENYYRGGGE